MQWNLVGAQFQCLSYSLGNDLTISYQKMSPEYPENVPLTLMQSLPGNLHKVANNIVYKDTITCFLREFHTF